MRIALLLAATLFVSICEAQTWSSAPSITVLGRDGDARIALVREAVIYWNDIFAEIGSALRLGPVRVAPGAIPVNELRDLSGEILRRRGGPVPMPDSVAKTPGELVIALSEGDFISFAARWPAEGKALAAIKSELRWPMTVPNVARNIVAHEIGHAIGLRHNDDPAMLMCGRPAPCRPDATESPTPRIFPLSAGEKEQLRRMYPPL